MASRRPRLRHDQVIYLYALLGGLPAVAAAIWLLQRGDYSPLTRWTVDLAVLGIWLGFASALHARVVRPLQTMANLLTALRQGDFSVRARGGARAEALADVMAEINTLSSLLQQQRLSALEATTLLRRVMAEIEVAIFAFDDEGILRLANSAGEKLLGLPAERLLGRTAREVGLEDCLAGEAIRILPRAFGARSGPGSADPRWGMRRSQFRQGGRAHQLIVIGDLSRPLREEELLAWQRLVRVLGHELNNSLTPIKSIAGSLGSLMRKDPRPPDWEGDVRSGLEIVESRADSLARFLAGYASLARLPPPVRAPCDLGALVGRVLRLETSVALHLVPGEPVTLEVDAGQMEQALINLVKNALEASLERAGAAQPAPAVTVRWTVKPDVAEIMVEDNGPGLANSANLFVPFFTTKPEGSGIGLVLTRQIVENHGGSLTLTNRREGPGCVAIVALPRPISGTPESQP
ncbi:MAG TPA: ATP-binding protein [Opitutaceae bacterium]|nr:ATP-binding protein [Opitutaceae bacterium]